MRVAVNIAATQFRQINLLDIVRSARSTRRASFPRSIS